MQQKKWKKIRTRLDVSKEKDVLEEPFQSEASRESIDSRG